MLLTNDCNSVSYHSNSSGGSSGWINVYDNYSIIKVVVAELK